MLDPVVLPPSDDLMLDALQERPAARYGDLHPLYVRRLHVRHVHVQEERRFNGRREQLTRYRRGPDAGGLIANGPFGIVVGRYRDRGNAPQVAMHRSALRSPTAERRPPCSPPG